MPTTTMVIGILVLLAVVVALSSIRIAKEYERGVVFRLGRLIDLKGPGLFLWQCLDPRPAVVANLRTLAWTSSGSVMAGGTRLPAAGAVRAGGRRVALVAGAEARCPRPSSRSRSDRNWPSETRRRQRYRGTSIRYPEQVNPLRFSGIAELGVQRKRPVKS
jgi:hypothetical protein